MPPVCLMLQRQVLEARETEPHFPSPEPTMEQEKGEDVGGALPLVTTGCGPARGPTSVTALHSERLPQV